MNRHVVAIIPAAGLGQRIGRGAKSFLSINNEPILLWICRVFQLEDLVNGIIVAVPPGEEMRAEKILSSSGITKILKIVTGGAIRQESVANALNVLPEWLNGDDLVAVHDAARPLLSREYLDKVLKEACETGAALLAVPVKDTIKMAGNDKVVLSTPSRDTLWAAQTPQVFCKDIIERAYEAAFAEGFVGTDDASLVERIGVKVKIVESIYENMKITTPEDLILASRIIEMRENRDERIFQAN